LAGIATVFGIYGFWRVPSRRKPLFERLSALRETCFLCVISAHFFLYGFP
jgi:hypothetical protein